MRRGLAALALLALAQGAAAQTAPDPAPPSPRAVTAPLLVLEPERLFRDSAFGQASAARVAAGQAALVAENRRLEAALEAEERDLTNRRASLPPDEFRALAAAFDAKAEETRATQQAKDRAITEQAQADRQRFLQEAAPVLAQIMGDTGAVAILDKQVVFLSFEAIDVTDRAIALIDARIGDGTGTPAPPAPAPAP